MVGRKKQNKSLSWDLANNDFRQKPWVMQMQICISVFNMETDSFLTDKIKHEQKTLEIMNSRAMKN